MMEILNHKSQIPNIKQITMTEIQNSKQLTVWFWSLAIGPPKAERFICNLVLDIWNFIIW